MLKTPWYQEMLLWAFSEIWAIGLNRPSHINKRRLHLSKVRLFLASISICMILSWSQPKWNAFISIHLFFQHISLSELLSMVLTAPLHAICGDPGSPPCWIARLTSPDEFGDLSHTEAHECDPLPRVWSRLFSSPLDCFDWFGNLPSVNALKRHQQRPRTGPASASTQPGSHLFGNFFLREINLSNRRDPLDARQFLSGNYHPALTALLRFTLCS